MNSDPATETARPDETDVIASGPGRGWDLLMLCLSGYILTSVARIHQLFPVLALIRPVTLTGVLAIAICLLDRRPAGSAGAFQIRATRYLVVLGAWLVLSVPGALWPGGAFATLNDFIKTVLIFLVIVTAVRTARDVERLTLVYFFGTVIFAAVVLSRMQFQLSAEGRMERLYFYDSNDFATYAVTALPLGLCFAFTAQRRLLRFAAWAGIGLLGLGFIWSGSRGGFLALLAVVTYFLLRYTGVKRVWRLSAVSAIGLLVVASASDAYWTRISTVLRPGQDYNLTSDQGRLKLWRRGIGYMMDHPLLGVGAGNFPRAEGTISPLVSRQSRGRGLKWGPPHNSYVQVGAELGIPGLIIFTGFLVNVFGTLRRSTGTPGVPKPLAQSLTAALIGWVVGAFFLTLAYSDMLYILAAIAVALRKVSIDASPIDTRPAHQSDRVRVTQVAGVTSPVTG